MKKGYNRFKRIECFKTNTRSGSKTGTTIFDYRIFELSKYGCHNNVLSHFYFIKALKEFQIFGYTVLYWKLVKDENENGLTFNTHDEAKKMVLNLCHEERKNRNKTIIEELSQYS